MDTINISSEIENKKSLAGDIEKSKVSPSGAGIKRENDSLDDFEHLDPDMSPLKDMPPGDFGVKPIVTSDFSPSNGISSEFHRSESPSKLLSEIDKELSFNKTGDSISHVTSDAITATKDFLADLTKPQTELIHPIDVHSATFDIQKEPSPKQAALDSELVADVHTPADKKPPFNEFDVTKFLETESSKIKTDKLNDLNLFEAKDNLPSAVPEKSAHDILPPKDDKLGDNLFSSSTPIRDDIKDDSLLKSSKIPELVEESDDSNKFIETLKQEITDNKDTFDDFNSLTAQVTKEDSIKVTTPEPVKEPTPGPQEAPTTELVKIPSPEPVKEPSPEPLKELTPEPVKEPSPELLREPTPEPVKEPIPVKELTPEPAKEKTPEPVKEKTPEPVKEKTPESLKEPTPEPLKKPAHEPVKEPTPEPVKEPTPEPVKKPTPEPVKELTPEPLREPTPEPVKEPTPEPVRELTPEPVKEPTPEPVRELTPEPVKEPTPEPIRELTPEPVREPTPESKKELQPETYVAPTSIKKPEPEPVTESESEPEYPKHLGIEDAKVLQTVADSKTTESFIKSESYKPEPVPEKKPEPAVIPIKKGKIVKTEPSSLDDIIGPEDVFKKIGLDAWFNPDRLHPRVESLVYWRDPKKSGIVFGGIMAILLSLSYFSLISVVAYVSLLTLTGTIIFRVYKNILQAVQKTSEGHPFKEYLEMEVSLPQDKVREAVDTAVTHINAYVVELRRLFLVEDLVDSIKFGVLLWCLTYLGALFNGMTLVIIAFVALFTLPKIYENNKTNIDAYLEIGRSKVAEITSKVKAAVPIGKKEPEKDKEQ